MLHVQTPSGVLCCHLPLQTDDVSNVAAGIAQEMAGRESHTKHFWTFVCVR